MNQWEDDFDWQILDRGYDYYESGSIKSIYQKKNTVYAVVKGTYDYHVTVDLDDDGEISFTDCDCPYGLYCKHCACVCYHIENKYVKKISDNQPETTAFDDTLTEKEFETYLKRKLDEYSKNELESFIIELILDDDDNYRKLMKTKKLNNDDVIIYKKRLNNILVEDIDIEDNHEFIRQLNNFIEIDMKKVMGDDEYSLDMIRLILLKLASIEYACNSDELEKLLNKTIDILDKTPKNRKDKKQIEETFSYIAKNYPNMLLIDNYTILFDKYIKTNDKDTQLELYHQQLMQCEDYNKEEKLADTVRKLEKEKYTNSEIIGFIKKQDYIKGYWKIYALYLAKDKQINKAEEILNNHISKKSYHEDSINALELLKEIYLDNNDKRYIDCIEKLIFNHTHYSNKNIDLLKKYYKDNWIDKRKEILDFYTNNAKSYMLDLLLYEKEYESFENIIFKNPEIFYINRYDKILRDKYPDKLFEAYQKVVLEKLLEARPKSYYDSCEIFRQMKKIPGKKEETRDFIKYTIELYPRRSRMIKEFEKYL